MDNLQQVKAKLEQMKAKYNFEHENEDNPNHSDGWGMFYSGFFTCLKEISFFIDTLEVKEVDFSTEIYKYIDEHFNVYDDGNQTLQTKDKKSLIGRVDVENIAKHFFELALSLKNS